ncbi:hypothetical protein B5M09_013017, partial [Aphanomyces astaci]
EARIQSGESNTGGGYKCSQGFFVSAEGLNLLSEWGRGRYYALVHAGLAMWARGGPEKGYGCWSVKSEGGIAVPCDIDVWGGEVRAAKRSEDVVSSGKWWEAANADFGIHKCGGTGGMWVEEGGCGVVPAEAEAVLAFRGPVNTADGSPVVAWAMSSGHPGMALDDGVSCPKGAEGAHEVTRGSFGWIAVFELVEGEAVVEHTSILVDHNYRDVAEKRIPTSWRCPGLDGALEGVPDELLAVFEETPPEGKAAAFLADILYLASVVDDAELVVRRLE